MDVAVIKLKTSNMEAHLNYSMKEHEQNDTMVYRLYKKYEDKIQVM